MTKAVRVARLREGLSCRGLRAGLSVALAETDASDAEISAVQPHPDPATVGHCRRDASHVGWPLPLGPVASSRARGGRGSVQQSAAGVRRLTAVGLRCSGGRAGCSRLVKVAGEGRGSSSDYKGRGNKQTSHLASPDNANGAWLQGGGGASGYGLMGLPPTTEPAPGGRPASGGELPP
jgi:hypothetical protein